MFDEIEVVFLAAGWLEGGKHFFAYMRAPTRSAEVARGRGV